METSKRLEARQAFRRCCPFEEASNVTRTSAPLGGWRCEEGSGLEIEDASLVMM
jgi:hypothetical protein